MAIGMDLRAIVTVLIEARIKRGLTQEQVAAQLGVTRQCLSAWELFANSPTLARLLAWAKALGVRLVAMEADIVEEDATDNCAHPETAVAA